MVLYVIFLGLRLYAFPTLLYDGNPVLSLMIGCITIGPYSVDLFPHISPVVRQGCQPFNHRLLAYWNLLSIGIHLVLDTVYRVNIVHIK